MTMKELVMSIKEISDSYGMSEGIKIQALKVLEAGILNLKLDEECKKEAEKEEEIKI